MEKNENKKRRPLTSSQHHHKRNPWGSKIESGREGKGAWSPLAVHLCSALAHPPLHPPHRHSCLIQLRGALVRHASTSGGSGMSAP